MGHRSVPRIVLEVGPATVRRLGDAGGPPGDSVRAALAGIDDPVVLLGERPVAVPDLWRSVIESALGESVPGPGGAGGGALLVHPSWWPQPRVGRVVAAAAAAGIDSVVALSRCAFIAARVTGVVVEVDGEFVTIGDRDGMTVLARRDIRGIGEALSRRDVEVFLDAPPGGPPELRDLLMCRGVRPTRVDLDTLLEAPGREPDPGLRRVRRPGVLAGAAALVLAAAVAVGNFHADGPGPEARALDLRMGESAEAASLVEGRVAVRIPPHWGVDRVTTGPGSRRVEVRPPADPDTALHITQSYVPESTLADTAGALRRAVAAQPPGVFVDLRTTAVAGRETVSYREIRPGRVIRWSVLLDGVTRISIGCQSGAGREAAVEAACAQAIGSAREYGTEKAR